MTKKLPVIQNSVDVEFLEEIPKKIDDGLDIAPTWMQYMPKNTPAPFDKSYISFSELTNWMECSMKHKLKYIDGIKLDGPTEHTQFGQVLHDACEQYLKTKVLPDPAVFAELVNEEFAKLPNAKDLKKKDWADQVAPILNSLPKFMEENFPEWEYVGAEFELMEEIENQNRKFHGFIDGIIKTPKKARKNSKTKPSGYDYFILDWKTTSWGWNMEKKTDIKKTYQLVYYKYFWAKKLGIPLTDIKTGFVLLKRTSKSDERAELVPVGVGDVTLARAMETLNQALNSMKKGFYSKNKDACKFCKYSNTVHCP